MIPGNIQRKHIIDAIQILKKDGVPAKRDSTKFDLLYEDEIFPPKYLVSIANKIVNKKELSPNHFSGGIETNRFLTRLGFSIVDKETNEILIQSSLERNSMYIPRQNEHIKNGRCSECKNTIFEMLREIYGLIKVEHKFTISTQLDDYKDLKCYTFLKKIYSELVALRGYDAFNKANYLQPCDVYVVESDFIIELDESQHFSNARLIALESYPDKLEVGYDVEKWKRLCKKINSKDNDPVYRDEQRAWYDTLRDFVSMIDDTFQPTMRIYTNDFEWCSLNPNNEKDIEIFKKKAGLTK